MDRFVDAGGTPLSIQPQAATGSGQGEAILRAVATSARRFGREPWEEVIREVLHLLGEAAGVSRAYVFENSLSPQGELLLNQRYEWCKLGIKPTIYDPASQEYPYRPTLARWERLLGGGSTIFGNTRDFPESERENLEYENILSAVLMPIFDGAHWWGYMGFDDCVKEREWTYLEVSALEAAAETLGGAITRAEVTEQLAESEARFRSHIEGLPAITYIEYTDSEHSLGYNEVYISPQIETILGYSPETWMQDTDASWWNSIVHPEDRDIIEREARRTAESGEPYVIEYRIKKKSGEWAWIRDQAYLVEEGPHPYWHGLMIDITDRREAEDHAREIEKRYCALLDRLPESFDKGDL